METIRYRLKIANHATNKLLRPQIDEYPIAILCKFPTEIRLLAPNTTLERRSFYLTSLKPFELKVEAYDELNQKFLDNSNLEYTWEFDGVTKLSNNPFKFELLSSDTHTIKVASMKIEGRPELTFPKVRDEIEIKTTKSFYPKSQGVFIEQANLLVHPSNKLIVDILDGSGQFTVLCIDDILKCTYHESSRKIEITPIKSGETSVRIIDSFVYGTETKDIKINVLDPTWMTL